MPRPTEFASWMRHGNTFEIISAVTIARYSSPNANVASFSGWRWKVVAVVVVVVAIEVMVVD